MSNTFPTSGAPRILIVEDELLVRMFAVDALEDAGFQIAQAGDAAGALAAFDPDANGFAAVVIDLGLPDRSGDLLAADIRKLRPDLPILIASGRSERELKDRFARDAHVSILVKPYTSTLLITALEMLGVNAPTP